MARGSVSLEPEATIDKQYQRLAQLFFSEFMHCK
jgi:hypothetical protein